MFDYDRVKAYWEEFAQQFKDGINSVIGFDAVAAAVGGFGNAVVNGTDVVLTNALNARDERARAQITSPYQTQQTVEVTAAASEPTVFSSNVQDMALAAVAGMNKIMGVSESRRSLGGFTSPLARDSAFVYAQAQAQDFAFAA